MTRPERLAQLARRYALFAKAEREYPMDDAIDALYTLALSQPWPGASALEAAANLVYATQMHPFRFRRLANDLFLEIARWEAAQ